MAANARRARVITSNKTNPTFILTEIGRQFSFGETAAYILVLGDRIQGKVPRSWVEYLFREFYHSIYLDQDVRCYAN
jgi:hypothetical protein